MNEYIIGFDYGKGGVWCVVESKSEEDIKKLYPYVDIFSERPLFMSDENISNRRKSKFSLENVPADADVVLKSAKDQNVNLIRNIIKWDPTLSSLPSRTGPLEVLEDGFQEFIVGFNLGDGSGLWRIVEARSADEIKHFYPDVDVYDKQPSFMNDTSFRIIRRLGVERIADIPEMSKDWHVVLSRAKELRAK